MNIVHKLTCLLIIVGSSVMWSGASAQQMPPSAPPTYMGDEPDCREYWPDGKLKQPGDYGYGHRCLHPEYRKLYSSGKCHCHTGACRPTRFREGQNGTEVLIDGNWYTFSPEALRRKNVVPEGLWPQEGHVCALPTGKLLPDGRPEHILECVLDNRGS